MLKRDVVFRGKSKSTGEWVFGNLFDEDTKGRTHIGTTVRMCFDIDPETVGQFTGRTDKNKKRIFEGDMVVNKAMHGKMWVVEYRTDTEYVGFVLKEVGTNSISVFTSWNDIEVIGNIHDNKELLK